MSLSASSTPSSHTVSAWRNTRSGSRPSRPTTTSSGTAREKTARSSTSAPSSPIWTPLPLCTPTSSNWSTPTTALLSMLTRPGPSWSCFENGESFEFQVEDRSYFLLPADEGLSQDQGYGHG